MRWPRWLVRLIPRLAPKASWGDVVLERNNGYLDLCEALYDDVVRRIRWVRPDAIRMPRFSRRLYLLDAPLLPAPYTGRWGVAFPQHADGGNPGGNVVILKRYRDNPDLLSHEFAHLITGITDHPDWLFASDGISLALPREAP